jgi:hypothetical protein
VKLSKRALTGLIGIILLVGTACGGAKTATGADGVSGASSSSKGSVSAESKISQEDQAAVKGDLELAEQVAAEAVAKAAKQLAGKQTFGQPSAVQPRKPVKGEAAEFEDALLQMLPAVRQSVREGVR